MAAVIEFEDDLIWVTCSGSDFHDQVETCKYLKMSYNASKKKWSISPGKIKEVLDEFSTYGVQISEYDKMAINNYIDGLSNFHQILKRSERRHFKPELMKKPPYPKDINGNPVSLPT